MRDDYKRCLVLNADYTAIGMVDWEKAVTADFKGTVVVVKCFRGDDAFIVCSGGLEWPIPAVVALREFQRQDKRKIPFSRKNVFIRDKLKCQYCGVRYKPRELTFDHVIPRAKWDSTKLGTPTKWTNIVTCCYPCNNKKSDMTLEQAKMSLLRKPLQPRPSEFVLGLAPWNKLQKEWIEYLPALYKEVCETDDSFEEADAILI